MDCIDMPSNSRWRKSLYHGVLCIVLETHPCGHLWKLGCKSGVLDQWYSRNQSQPTLEKFMNITIIRDLALIKIDLHLQT